VENIPERVDFKPGKPRRKGGEGDVTTLQKRTRVLQLEGSKRKEKVLRAEQVLNGLINQRGKARSG